MWIIFGLVKHLTSGLILTYFTLNDLIQISSSISVLIQVNNKMLIAQLSQRDRATGCVIVYAKSRTLELGDNILRTV